MNTFTVDLQNFPPNLEFSRENQIPSSLQLGKIDLGSEMEDLALKNDDARRLSIIDVSSEDDSLLGLAPGFALDDASSGYFSFVIC